MAWYLIKHRKKVIFLPLLAKCIWLLRSVKVTGGMSTQKIIYFKLLSKHISVSLDRVAGFNLLGLSLPRLGYPGSFLSDTELP
jgi:hypothetical protein